MGSLCRCPLIFQHGLRKLSLRGSNQHKRCSMTITINLTYWKDFRTHHCCRNFKRPPHIMSLQLISDTGSESCHYGVRLYSPRLHWPTDRHMATGEWTSTIKLVRCNMAMSRNQYGPDSRQISLKPVGRTVVPFFSCCNVSRPNIDACGQKDTFLSQGKSHRKAKSAEQ